MTDRKPGPDWLRLGLRFKIKVRVRVIGWHASQSHPINHTPASAHLTDGSLQDGIEAALRSVPVARHHLFLHFLVEAIHFVSQGEEVAEPEGGDTAGEQFVSVQRESFK